MGEAKKDSAVIEDYQSEIDVDTTSLEPIAMSAELWDFDAGEVPESISSLNAPSTLWGSDEPDFLDVDDYLSMSQFEPASTVSELYESSSTSDDFNPLAPA